MKQLFFLLLLSVFLLQPTFSFAQVILDGQLDILPENPKPYDTVTLTLKSYSFDADASEIFWYVNKILVKSGTGEKTYKLKLGAADTAYYVGVDVKTPDGQGFQTSVPLIPHFTPLLTEGVEGYTPPFYEGKSLYGESAKVRVVAFPIVHEGGVSISKKKMVYKWQVNTVPFPDASGYGKNSFILRQDELEEENAVDVTVSTPSKETVLSERLTVKPYEIAPLFYEYDPLYGINLNKAYEGTISVTKAIKLFYAPYNFAYSKNTSDFNWYLNGLPTTTDSDFLVSLIPNPNTVGNSNLSITAQHSTKLLQSLNSEINIDFDTTNQKNNGTEN